MAAIPSSSSGLEALDGRTRALVRLEALVATGGRADCHAREAAAALASGATSDDVVGTLVAVASIVGIAHVVWASVGLASGLGYDIDRALEAVGETVGFITHVG
jgi:alkylhydroperoxidase/carboxymuconolactone decarboxylase family protein YurZ